MNDKDEPTRSVGEIDEYYLRRHLKMRQLVVLDAVLEQESLVKAAEVLSLTQPAVTKTVQAIEEVLGVPLVERTSRGVHPTIYGACVHARIKAILTEVRYLGDDLAALGEAKRGHVVTGTLISAAAWLLPRAIVLLKERSPEVTITIQEGANDQLMPRLVTGEMDLVVGRIPYEVYPGVRHVPLYSERLCAVGRAGHPMATRDRLEVSDLADYPWIIPIHESPVRTTAERLFRGAGLGFPANRIDSLSILTNINIMRSTDTVCLLPEDVAVYCVREGLLSILPLDVSEDFGDVGISLAASRNPTPAAHAFIAALTEAARDRAPGQTGARR